MSGEWLLVLVLCGLGWLWWDGLQKRELAIQAARAACARGAVQLLDETVSLQRLRLQRDARRQVRLYREFAFEYTRTGDERLPGRVYLLGREILAAQLIEPA
ncbi:MAG: DUF3301 domain-containing protein [Pseudomonadota bacterium]